MHAATASNHPFQVPTNLESIPASVRLLKCPFRGGFKDSGSSTDGAATRKVCAIHSLGTALREHFGKINTLAAAAHFVI